MILGLPYHDCSSDRSPTAADQPGQPGLPQLVLPPGMPATGRGRPQPNLLPDWLEHLCRVSLFYFGVESSLESEHVFNIHFQQNVNSRHEREGHFVHLSLLPAPQGTMRRSWAVNAGSPLALWWKDKHALQYML